MTSSPLKRLLGVLLVAALVLTAPGLPFYRVMAADYANIEADANKASEEALQAPGSSLPGTAYGSPGLTQAPVNIVGLPDLGAVLPGAAAKLPTAPNGALGSQAAAQQQADLESSAQAPAEALGSDAGAEADADASPAAVAAGPAQQQQPPSSVLKTPAGVVNAAVARLKRYFSSPKAGADESEAAVRAQASASAAPVAEAPISADKPAAASQKPDGENVPLPAKSADDNGRPPSGNGQAPQTPDNSFRNAAWFVASMIVAQVGIEAWGAYSGKWTQGAYSTGQYSLLSTMGMCASLATGYIGGMVVDKLGIKRANLIAGLLSAATSGTALVLFAMHVLPFWGFAALTLTRMLFGSVAGAARGAIPIAIFKGDRDKLDSFNSSTQSLLEIPGMLVPLFIGTLITWFGTLGALALLPITGAAAALITAFFVKVDETARAKKKAVAAADKPAEAPPTRTTDPKLLRYSVMGYVGYILLNAMLYSIVALSYGNYLHPGTSTVEQAASAAVSGSITGYYSAGGLLVSVYLSGILNKAWAWLRTKRAGASLAALVDRTPVGRWLAAKAAAKAGAPEPTPAEKDAKALKDLARWMRVGAVGLAAFLPFMWSNPTVTAAAMVPFGITNVIGQLKLNSMMQSNTPLEKSGKIMGTISTVSTLASMGGFLGFNYLVDHSAAVAAHLPFLAGHFAAGALPFVILQVFLGLLAAFYVYVAHLFGGYAASKTPAKK